MSDTITITVRPFRMGTDKDAALKPLEEAAEVYGAWQNLDADSEKCDIADELADTITACVNLADRYHVDLQAALDRVEERNRERGRY